TCFFFSSRRRHTRWPRDWSSDVCSSDLFEDTPLAAASLAQVHAATLPDGTRVVVKVQVPGIEDVIEADIAALRTIASALGDVPRSEERRVGKECRSRGAPGHEKKKKEM